MSQNIISHKYKHILWTYTIIMYEFLKITWTLEVLTVHKFSCLWGFIFPTHKEGGTGVPHLQNSVTMNYLSLPLLLNDSDVTASEYGTWKISSYCLTLNKAYFPSSYYFFFFKVIVKECGKNILFVPNHLISPSKSLIDTQIK